MLCYVVLCYVLLCYVMDYSCVLWYVMSYPVKYIYICVCGYICFDWEMIHVEKLRHHVFDVAELVFLLINMGPLTSAWRNSFKRSWCGERYVGHKDPGLWIGIPIIGIKSTKDVFFLVSQVVVYLQISKNRFPCPPSKRFARWHDNNPLPQPTWETWTSEKDRRSSLKMIFQEGIVFSTGLIFRFHVKLQGCRNAYIYKYSCYIYIIIDITLITNQDHLSATKEVRQLDRTPLPH